MTTCDSMKNAVMKRVNEGKDIKEIGEQLCDGLKYPKRKITEIIREIKGEAYLIENKKRLKYRGGGGRGKPRKAKKPELQNIAVRARIKKKFTLLIKKCHDAHPNDWKEIILKCIEDFEAALLKANQSNQTPEQPEQTSSAPNALASETTQTTKVQEQRPSDVTSSTAQSEQGETSLVEPSTSESASAKELELGQYLFSWDNIGSVFCWDDIPKKNFGRLERYLKRKYDIKWVDKSKIKKIDERTIKVSTKKNSLLLTLNEDKTKVNLIIDDNRTFELNARMENDKLHIYTSENDNSRLIECLSMKLGNPWIKKAEIIKNINDDIIVRTERRRLFLKVNDKRDKAIIEINGNATAEFKARAVNGELNIYSG